MMTAAAPGQTAFNRLLDRLTARAGHGLWDPVSEKHFSCDTHTHTHRFGLSCTVQAWYMIWDPPPTLKQNPGYC